MPDDSAAVIRALEQMDRLRAAPLSQAIEALNVQPETRVLDIGCGIGLQLLQLRQSTRPEPHVVGVDLAPPLLANGKQRMASLIETGQISLAAADMRALPFADDSFDLCWSADCLGYPASDHLPLLKEAARVARRGAQVALLAWSSQTLLPGHTLHEARLNATASAYAPYLAQSAPEQHFMRLSGAFPSAGIQDCRIRTFVGEVAAPLDGFQRAAIAALFEMLWRGGLQSASQADQAAYARLCSPDSPDFVPDLPDYCGFFTYTMFTGVVHK